MFPPQSERGSINFMDPSHEGHNLSVQSSSTLSMVLLDDEIHKWISSNWILVLSRNPEVLMDIRRCVPVSGGLGLASFAMSIRRGREEDIER